MLGSVLLLCCSPYHCAPGQLMCALVWCREQVVLALEACYWSIARQAATGKVRAAKLRTKVCSRVALDHPPTCAQFMLHGIWVCIARRHTATAPNSCPHGEVGAAKLRSKVCSRAAFVHTRTWHSSCYMASRYAMHVVSLQPHFTHILADKRSFSMFSTSSWPRDVPPPEKGLVRFACLVGL